MNKNIPIFFAVDNNYAPFLCVVLESIIANSSKEYCYQIYVLNDDITPKYQEYINKYNSSNIEINFVCMKEKIAEFNKVLPTRDYYSNAIFFRLFIAEIFKDIDKAIYLDADIIVLSDISKLFNTDISNYYLGVCCDDVTKIYPDFRNYIDNGLGVDNTLYFNSGILVMNLDKLRKEKLFDRFKNLLNDVSFYICPDQDYLNVLTYNNVLHLDPLWNAAPLDGFDISNAKIIHYKFSMKPWHYPNINRAEDFWYYAKKTEFYDYLLNILNSYTDELKAKDFESHQKLLMMLNDETNRLIPIRNKIKWL